MAVSTAGAVEPVLDTPLAAQVQERLLRLGIPAHGIIAGAELACCGS